MTTQAAPDHGCRSCGRSLDGAGLQLGPVPISNRFAARAADQTTVSLEMMSCNACALIQLRRPPSPSLVMPRMSWIRYNEPEAHLDDLADAVMAHMSGKAGAAEPMEAIGLGPFEMPLLARFAARDVTVSGPDLLSMKPPLADAGCTPYLESWEDALVSGADSIAGGADIVSCRYLLEHFHDPLTTLRALGRLLRTGGLLILEVPDSAKFLAACDYAFPWEEHVSYFVEDTFRTLAERAGFETVEVRRYPGRLEDALVGLFRPAVAEPRGESVHGPDPLFAAYGAAFATTRSFVQERLATMAGPARDRVAIFGAGHQASMFASALQVGPWIGAVVDDDPDKRGLVAPGFAVPITPSSALIENGAVQTCLLAINPNSEPKVREKLAPLAARGVALRSIYAGVPGSILEGRP